MDGSTCNLALASCKEGSQSCKFTCTRSFDMKKMSFDVWRMHM